MYKYNKDLMDIMNRYHLDSSIKYYPIKKKKKKYENYIIITLLSIIITYFLIH